MKKKINKKRPPAQVKTQKKIPNKINEEQLYLDELESLQKKLSLIQQAVMLQNKRAVIVLEGIDAAGKGGLIRRVSWAMDPRGLKVWPISAPSKEEKGQHYLQRFWKCMPNQGQIAVFDRSWYGRVLVERVEKLASKEAWTRAYNEINQFEQQLIDDGIIVIKIFLKIGHDEQLRRFKERLERPEKRWKLTFEDFRNRENKKEYDLAFKDMFTKTGKSKCPWHIVESDHKKWSRLQSLKIIISELSEHVDLTPPKISPEIMGMARRLLKNKNFK